MPEVGERWAYREKARTMGGPVRQVEVLQHGPPRSRKVRIRWLDGEYEGLDEWVPEVRLVVAWQHLDAFLQDEELLTALRILQPEPPEKAVIDAVETVWLATADEDLDFFASADRPIELTVSAITDREDLVLLKEDLLASAGAFLDSGGELHAGQDAALHVARQLCSQSSEKVLAYTDREVQRARQAALTGWYESDFHEEGGFRVDTKRARDLLHEREAAASIIRHWCGEVATADYDEVVALRAEVDRLGTLIERTATWLKQAGHPQKAALLIRERRDETARAPTY